MQKNRPSRPGSTTGFRLPGPAILVLSLALLLPGCDSPTEPTATLWEGTLAAVPPATVVGSAAAVAQFGRTLASLGIRMATEGVTYGWRIETGTCQAPGQIQGGEAMYPLLTADEVGVADADAVVAGLLRSGSSYVVRVLRDPGGSGEQAVACGQLLERN